MCYPTFSVIKVCVNSTLLYSEETETKVINTILLSALPFDNKNCTHITEGSFCTCEDFGGRFDNSFPACTFFFIKWRSICAHQYHFFFSFFLGQDQSIVAQ